MQTFLLALVVFAVAAAPAPQRRGAGGTGTLAINVTDPDGAGIPYVLVTIEGPASRSTRTEGGRIAIEKLPPGAYRLKFEREGFVTLERELTLKAGAPTEVKVTLTPVPAPPPAPAPPDPPKAASAGEPAMADVLAVIDKEFVGRNPGRVTQLSCSGDVNSTLIQLNEPLAEHSHEADEVFYVIAGEGTAQVGERQQKLKAGIYLFVPRGTPHALTKSGRNPLIVLSTRTGEPCRQ